MLTYVQCHIVTHVWPTKLLVHMPHVICHMPHVTCHMGIPAVSILNRLGHASCMVTSNSDTRAPTNSKLS